MQEQTKRQLAEESSKALDSKRKVVTDDTPLTEELRQQILDVLGYIPGEESE